MNSRSSSAGQQPFPCSRFSPKYLILSALAFCPIASWIKSFFRHRLAVYIDQPTLAIEPYLNGITRGRDILPRHAAERRSPSFRKRFRIAVNLYELWHSVIPLESQGHAQPHEDRQVHLIWGCGGSNGAVCQSFPFRSLNSYHLRERAHTIAPDLSIVARFREAGELRQLLKTPYFQG